MSTRSLILFNDSEGFNYIAVTLYRHCDGYPEGLGKDLYDAFQTIPEGTNYDDIIKSLVSNPGLGDIRFVPSPDFKTDDPKFLAKLNSFAGDAEYLYHFYRKRGQLMVSVINTDWGPMVEGKGLTTWATDTLVEPKVLYQGDIKGMAEHFGFEATPKP